MTSRRARIGYFGREPGAPLPLRLDVPRRVRFNETDPMGIVWHGRYAAYFEEGAAELGRRCGLSYRDFMECNVRAPIATLHADYLKPLYLDEEFTIRCSLIWCDGAKLNTEYDLIKADGSLAARGWTVQVFTNAATGDVYLVPPPLLERCRVRWKAGDFGDLQA